MAKKAAENFEYKIPEKLAAMMLLHGAQIDAIHHPSVHANMNNVAKEQMFETMAKTLLNLFQGASLITTNQVMYAREERPRRKDINREETKEETVGPAKERLICYRCGGYGHFAKECATKRKEKNWIGMTEQLIMAGIKSTELTLESEGIIDTGASACVCGSRWLQKYETLLNDLGEAEEIVRERREEEFKFNLLVSLFNLITSD